MALSPKSSALSFRTSWMASEVSGEIAFSALAASHDKAIERMPQEASTTRIVLGGAEAQMNVVGHRLASSISRAFRHLILAQPMGSPQLTIDLWDERATGIDCPDAVSAIERQVKAERQGRLFVAVGRSGDRYVGYFRPGMVVWMDRESARVVGWVADGTQLSMQDRAKPLHFPLLLWHADRKTPVVHAALVSWVGQGALLIGREGAGKTSAAAACFLGGLDFLGDDYIALQRIGSDRFVGHSLYDSMLIRPDTEARCPELTPYLQRINRFATDGKRLLRSTDVAPLRVVRSAEIRDIMAIEQCEGATVSITPMSKREAFLCVAPNSMLKLPVSGSILMERMAELVDRVPVHRLAVDGDLAVLPSVIKKRLARGESR